MTTGITRRRRYHLFNEDSWKQLLEREEARNLRLMEKGKYIDEGRLVDGELKFFSEEDDDLSLKPDADMIEGCILPEEKTGAFPTNLYGRPLEEIDENILNKTFVVINTRCRAKYIYRFTATKSCFLFAPWNPFRRLTVMVSTNQFFDYLIMMTIFVNCVFLAINGDYAIPEYVFLAIYTLEMLVRMTAKGFVINSYTYLRDPYNILDISIVIMSYVMLIIEKLFAQNNVNISSLRTLRVLRALKTITIMPALKTIISALIRSMRMLLEVLILSFFCMSIFALLALQIYQGLLHNKCVHNVDWLAVVVANNTTADNFYHRWVNNPEHWAVQGTNYLTCGNDTGAGNCSSTNRNTTCLKNIGPNPNYGYTNFDNFGWALLAMLQLITLDFWEDQYNTVIRAGGSWNILFYIIVVFFGSFYLMNLMLAVVSMSYEEEALVETREKEKEVSRRKKIKNREYKLDIQMMKKRKEDANGEDIGKVDEDKKDNLATISEEEEGKRGTLQKNVNQDDVDDEEEPQDETETLNEDETLPSTSVASRGADRNCKGCCRASPGYQIFLRFQNRLYTIITDPFLDLFISFCILMNTIIMASEHYPSDSHWEQILQYSNMMFTVIFVLEASLKITAMSKEYFTVGWNTFDFIVVIASLIDLGVEEVKALSIFRAFRLLRVFKLAQSWQTMKVLLTIIFSSVTEMGNLTLVVVLVLYMFAVIGMQCFGNTYDAKVFGENLPRWNFNDFWHSMILVFRIVCGEWMQPMLDCARANGPVCLLVFIPTLVIGNFVVLNLFLALLLNSFASDNIKSSNTEEESKLRLVIQRLEKIFPCRKAKKVGSDGDAVDLESEDLIKEESGKKCEDARALNGADINVKTESLPKDFVEPAETEIEDTGAHPEIGHHQQETSCSLLKHSPNKVQFEDALQVQEDDKEIPMLQNCCWDGCMRMCETGHPCQCCNCLLWEKDTVTGSRWYNFRNGVLLITEHRFFEGTVLIVILGSSISLCFEDIYLDNNPTLKAALGYLNYVYAALFFVEMVLKITSLGFKVYFTNFWTILDFFIVSITFVSIVNEVLGIGKDIAAFRSLRTMRALRPLRAISRWQGMKIVVNALIYAIPSIFNVLLVCLVFWLVFCISGVQFFKGKFFKCIDSMTGTRLPATLVPNKSECGRLNHSWINSHINFDNVTNGFLALFQLATFEGWIEIMHDGVDSTDVDLQPITENNMGYFGFFVIFILVGSFFTLNLFIGVIIDNFNRLKNKYEGNYLDVFLTASQRNYYITMRKLSNRKPKKTIRRPKNLARGFFYDVAMSTKFEVAIVTLIFLNMVAMMIEHYKQPDIFTQVLDMINIMFTTIFTMEAIIKIIGLDWHYFRYMWNVFDFIIVILSIVDVSSDIIRSVSSTAIIINETLKNAIITPTLLRVVRVFRIGRVLRLIKIAKGIRKLLFALIISLPALLNIGALLLLIVFIYAIIGMTVFGDLRHTGALDDLVNFETFERTMLLLFRLTTAGGWNDILDSMYLQPPNCNDTHVVREGIAKETSNGDCGIPWFATMYMTTFIFVNYLIIINMYIAIILENFNQAHDQEEVGITEDDFEMYYMVWERYDPHASQYIKFANLSNFVAELDEPLGIAKPNVIALVSFDLPIVEGDMLHCLDILIALVKNVIGDVEDSEEFREIKKQMEIKYEQVFPTRVQTNVISTTMRRKKEDIAAKTLQRAWNRHKMQKTLKQMSDNASSFMTLESHSPCLSRRHTSVQYPHWNNFNLTRNEKAQTYLTVL